MPRVCQTITVAAAGTPVCAATGTTSAVAKGTQSRWVKNPMVQALHGESVAFGYLLAAPAGIVPAHGTSGQLLGEIPPGSSTGPGVPFSMPVSEVPYDLHGLWVDASHSGDAFVLSYDSSAWLSGIPSRASSATPTWRGR